MFDEPLTVIDPHLKWQLRSKLKELHQRIRAHDDLCHPRPDRGADLRRQGRGDARRRGGADRLAGRAVRAAAAHLRRPFHRLAGHERAALRGARTARVCSAGSRSRSQNPPAAPLNGKRARDRRAARSSSASRADGIPVEIVKVSDAGRYRIVEARHGDEPHQRCWSPRAPRCRRKARVSGSIPPTRGSTPTAGWWSERHERQDRKPEGLAASSCRSSCWSRSTPSFR